MPTVTAFRHVAFEDMGTLEDIFAARKWKMNYIDVPVADWKSIDPLKPDVLVVLGGPIGAYEENIYPFLTPELAAIKKRLDDGKPTLGICLGAQLIARALGANVYPNREKEVGWGPLLMTAKGLNSPARHLAAEHTFMLHWHGDTFDLPQGATLLAGTEACLHQAFSWGKATLAFQCHAEVRARDMEKWFVGHAVEISSTHGVNVPFLRRETARYGAALEKQGKLCFEEWLDSLKG
jgi:GMP synthase (glutamine-hydrolysing)